MVAISHNISLVMVFIVDNSNMMKLSQVKIGVISV